MQKEKGTFWSRVGHWFRAAAPMESGSLEPVGAEPVPSVSRSGNGDRELASGDDGSPFLSRLRLARREPAIERLEVGYAKVAGLIESIQRHLQTQDERSAVMSRSLERLADHLAHAPETARAEVELLSGLHKRMEAQADVFRRFEESLSQWPRLADAQRETMAAIGRQLDLAREHAERSTTTLDAFQQAVTKLGDATGACTIALRDMHGDAAVREERLSRLLHEQTKRLTLVAFGAIVAAAAAGVIGLVALLRG
jgi:hypothetical protein